MKLCLIYLISLCFPQAQDSLSFGDKNVYVLLSSFILFLSCSHNEVTKEALVNKSITSTSVYVLSNSKERDSQCLLFCFFFSKESLLHEISSESQLLDTLEISHLP